jgi:hypothetical protein
MGQHLDELCTGLNCSVPIWASGFREAIDQALCPGRGFHLRPLAAHRRLERVFKKIVLGEQHWVTSEHRPPQTLPD